MKKQLLALTLVFVMLLGVATQAAGPMRAPSVKPELSYVVNIYAKVGQRQEHVRSAVI